MINKTIFKFFSCNITRLESGIFIDLPSLEILELTHNEIVELDKDLFKNLSALKELYLFENNISKWYRILFIRYEAFCNSGPILFKHNSFINKLFN